MEPFIIPEILYDDEVFGDTTVEPDGGTLHFIESTSGAVSGGTALRRSFIHDGQTWRNVTPMMTQRASPVCSLLEMDDGEV